jgi:hypothetical protein
MDRGPAGVVREEGDIVRRLLPDRRKADGDRREKPGAGYGEAESRDPTNQRIEPRRNWKASRRCRNCGAAKPRHPHRSCPGYEPGGVRLAPLDSPLDPDDEAELKEFLGRFER